MNDTPVAAPVFGDYVALGRYTRQWTIDNMTILSIYDRYDGYLTIVYMPDATHRFFTGRRAIDIYSRADRLR